jgi:hypothetical protein
MSLPSSGLKSKPIKKQREPDSKQSKWLAETWDYIRTKGTLEANPSALAHGRTMANQLETREK